MSDNRPHLTVATLVERTGKLLMVKERSEGRLVYNQPAGHVEHGEAIVAAAIRETLEETAWTVEVTDLLGIYQYTAANNGIAYVRLCFVATPKSHDASLALDQDIEEALWMSPAEIEQRHDELRSPLVHAAVKDYLAGKRYPLSAISKF